MSKLKKLISRFLGSTKYISPIFDGYLYAENDFSFCGGSLDYEDMLVVSNMDNNILESLKQQLSKENVCFNILDKVTSEEYSALELRYPASHVLLLSYLPLETNALTILTELYNQLQFLGDYLIDYCKGGNCTVVVISGDPVVLDSAESMIKGLGMAFSNHSIICNGVVSNRENNIDSIFPVALYLNSKYGQVLAGEVLEIME